MHELFTVLKLTENLISLAVLYILKSIALDAGQSITLLELATACNGDVLALSNLPYHQAMTKNRPCLSLRSRLTVAVAL